MNVFQVSVRAMIVSVLIAALDFVWLIHIGRMKSLFGFGMQYLDLPLLGMANVLAVSGYFLLVRPSGRPFLAGFIGGGLICSIAYVGYFLADPPLGGEVYVRYVLEIQHPIQTNRFLSTNFGPLWQSRLLFGFVTLAGTVLLSTLAGLFGLLNRLVARGKIPRWIALALVVVVLGSVTVQMRRIPYQRLADHYAEVYELLSAEARDRAKEIETLKSGNRAPIARTPEEIQELEANLARYKVPMAENLRQLERYRRALSHLWPVVEE